MPDCGATSRRSPAARPAPPGSRRGARSAGCPRSPRPPPDGILSHVRPAGNGRARAGNTAVGSVLAEVADVPPHGTGGHVMAIMTKGVLAGTDEVAGRCDGRRHPHSRGRRGHGGIRPGSRAGRARNPLEERPPGPGAPGFHRAGGLRRPHGPARDRQGYRGDPLRRHQQLVRRLRLLVLPLLRPRQGPADGRRPEEVGTGGAGR